MAETSFTAALLLAIGALLVASALVSRLTRRTGLPIALLFLGVGMFAGAQGGGGLPFHDYKLSLRFGTAALVLILFDGGLNTSLDHVKRWYRPASVLATFGVVLTAAVVAVLSRPLGLGWTEALLVGAVVSSTDAAAVFSALRASGVQLKRRIGITLELESGLNDPMAVILTSAVTTMFAGGDAAGGFSILADVVVHLAVGGVCGVAFGWLAKRGMARARLDVGGLYPVLTVGLAFLSFAIPTLFSGSGFLAVYLAAVLLGSGELPYRAGLLRVHDAIAWFAQVGMFLLLGLLVTPAKLLDVAVPGLLLGLILAFVARPVAVAACLAPFRYERKEMMFIGWAGLRGAVPIILATFPVLAHVEGAERVFHLVFFVVVVNSILPGATLGFATRKLRLESAAPPPPPASLEIASTAMLKGEIMVFHIDAASAVSQTRIADVPFPPASAAMLIVRRNELMAPRGNTTLEPGDHVYVFSRPEDAPLIHLLFGRGDHE